MDWTLDSVSMHCGAVLIPQCGVSCCQNYCRWMPSTSRVGTLGKDKWGDALVWNPSCYVRTGQEDDAGFPYNGLDLSPCDITTGAPRAAPASPDYNPETDICMVARYAALIHSCTLHCVYTRLPCCPCPTNPPLSIFHCQFLHSAG